MATREYMIKYRHENKLSLSDMAKLCNTSQRILFMLEYNKHEVTHPNIAERVGKAYNLTTEQTESMMPEHYRKSSPNYDPDLYRRKYAEPEY